MNYRHIFHAGNFGDVFKHALLVSLFRRMQAKEKGFVFLDTHGGIGGYDLTTGPADRTLEFQAGIGRLWQAGAHPEELRPYLELVRQFNRACGGPETELRFYPGSPCLASMLRREQDRLALSELHPEDFEALRARFARESGVSVQKIDAYSAIRAHLPPREGRALVLIDPPYEDANEVSRLHEGLLAGLKRAPAATFAVWYPIKDRSANEAFKAVLLTLPLPPTLAIELLLHPEGGANRLNGCGLIVLNPPWQIAGELAAIGEAVRSVLADEPGAASRLQWLYEED